MHVIVIIHNAKCLIIENMYILVTNVFIQITFITIQGQFLEKIPKQQMKLISKGDTKIGACNSMIIVKSGDQFIHELKNGEGMLYEVAEDLINPLRLIDTLSSEQVKKHK